MRYNRRLGGLLGGATRFAPRLIDGMSSELRNNRLDIGVQNEIVCRTRESYEHGTWMTAFTTVRNAELKGETAEEHTGKYRIFLSSSVVVGRRPLASEEAKSRRSENDNDRNTTCDNGLDRCSAKPTGSRVFYVITRTRARATRLMRRVYSRIKKLYVHETRLLSSILSNDWESDSFFICFWCFVWQIRTSSPFVFHGYS